MGLLETLSEEQFRYWVAYDKEYGLGPENLYRMLALIGAALCQCHPGGSRIRPKHFLPKSMLKRNKKQTSNDHKSAFRSVAMNHNAALKSRSRQTSSRRKRRRQCRP